MTPVDRFAKGDPARSKIASRLNASFDLAPSPSMSICLLAILCCAHPVGISQGALRLCSYLRIKVSRNQIILGLLEPCIGRLIMRFSHELHV
ncbi:hypothetical protein RGCCGE502_18800 [Rhizobium grahamii CCGE 502]|uniref:Uncharacterized protein n=1 Tax=Rhizobium grahamii CCGE 502 TaxID=990285 RepID=S3IBX0_9HYPH|nr:hypothetical protein RGCCGE502_18800 [Rhizobium grahamii CCGE 502]